MPHVYVRDFNETKQQFFINVIFFGECLQPLQKKAGTFADIIFKLQYNAVKKYGFLYIYLDSIKNRNRETK